MQAGGAALTRLARIDIAERDPRLAAYRLDVACDDSNPLTGPQGASAIFGPQKGATPDMVQVLDACLQRFATVPKQELGCELASVAGARAAGGMGAALLGVLGTARVDASPGGWPGYACVACFTFR